MGWEMNARLKILHTSLHGQQAKKLCKPLLK